MFHFDENKETLDSYITCIRQVTTLLGYGKPQVLEVFKIHSQLDYIGYSFLIEDLRLVVETAKMILTKEKIDRHLSGQSSLTPFMSIKDGYSSKKVAFDMHDSLDDKIDRLTSMMSTLTAQDDNLNKHFKPKIYQGKQRGQSRNFYN